MTEQVQENDDWVMPDAEEFEESQESAQFPAGEKGGEYVDEQQDVKSPPPDDDEPTPVDTKAPEDQS